MILPVIAALAIIGFIAAASKHSSDVTTTTVPTPAVAAGDDFSARVAAAIAAKDVAALRLLAIQAGAAGNKEAADSIMAEIARITGAAMPIRETFSPFGGATFSPYRVYTVKAGDSPYTIAKLFTGNGNRWSEMIPLNTGRKPGLPVVWTNEVLNLPASWPALPQSQPVAAPVYHPAPVAAPVVTVPAPVAAPVVTASPAQQAASPAPATSYQAPTPVYQAPAATLAPAGTQTYTVKSGDNAYTIAQYFTGNGSRWTEMVALNKSKVPALPSMWAGEVLNIPATWPIKLAAAAPAQSPVAQVIPTSGPPANHDGDDAALELTNYLRGLGGLAARYKENRSQVAALSQRLGIYDAKGMYGRDMAKAVMQHGFIPVAPFYWPSVGTAAAKNEFLALVKTYQAADPQRSADWSLLVADTVRS
jgi:nucleoid-associated protein YgaU